MLELCSAEKYTNQVNREITFKMKFMITKKLLKFMSKLTFDAEKKKEQIVIDSQKSKMITSIYFQYHWTRKLPFSFSEWYDGNDILSVLRRYEWLTIRLSICPQCLSSMLLQYIFLETSRKITPPVMIVFFTSKRFKYKIRDDTWIELFLNQI